MMRLRQLLLGFIAAGMFLIMSAGKAGAGGCTAWRGSGAQPWNGACTRIWDPRLLGLRRQIVYERIGSRVLTFYLFEWAGRGHRWSPAVVYIHGGALKFGTGIISAANTPHNHLLVQLERELIQEHINFISVNYRLAPAHPWPMPLDDVKHAMEFIVTHARRWQIDPRDLAVMGDSAGGELASFVGLTMINASTHRPLVRAVVDLFGPTDRQTFAQQWLRHYGLRPNPVYGVYTPKRVQKESAISHVHPGAPPFLIIQGTRDRVVPPQQSYLLRERLKRDGVFVEEILVHHAGHELRPVNGPIHPSLKELGDCINQFLVRHLTLEGESFKFRGQPRALTGGYPPRGATGCRGSRVEDKPG
ncbi:MAG: hypothetical protein C7B45_12335 [Sulfobacillus acidophilus]|uniref:BD-FAE-like domain-containing protein n=1 Tax=Sulfobacillus acidophilus TaxID=53633 RepID=A0A2T2WFR9_9FIRM|nr:MAG: hypothetical protein C7B45_12335 [Sulfobacillus acidophilus]